MSSRQWLTRSWSAGWMALVILAGVDPAKAEDAAAARMRKDITYLASDECEGRGVTTKGINLAADYIARSFKEAGLKPGGPDNSYFQPFTMTGEARLGSPNSLVLSGPNNQQIELKIGPGFRALGMSASGKLTAPVVFAGFGITNEKGNYDDYKGLDVAGKVVVILRKTPMSSDPHQPFAGDKNGHFAGLNTKMVNADIHEAAAILFVNDLDTAKKDDPLMDFGYTAFESSPAKALAVHVHRAVVDDMLRASRDTTLDAVEKAINESQRPASVPLTGWTAELEVTVDRPTIPVKNVVGVLEGAGPNAKETVVIGAHYDHLGYGGRSSLARDPKKSQIHHGADDNGSGTTVLIELARRFGQFPNRDGRRLVFIAFSGEESGLLGSEHYCNHPLFPLADTVAMINMDMVGRLHLEKRVWSVCLGMIPTPGLPLVSLAASLKGDKDKVFPARDDLIVYGTGTSKNFNELIDTVNKKYAFKLQKVASGMGPSDQESFYKKKVPVFFFFTGDHKDYHRPSDTSDKINIAGMGRIADMIEEVAVYLARSGERPQYVKVAESSPPRSYGSVPRLGIRPSYGDDQEGVLLEGVSEGGPAAKAGIKEGDRIVEFAGKTVKNLSAYMVFIQGHKKGEPVELGILRSGKKLVIKVTPE